MIRNLKALLLAAMAVLAMSAVASPAAQAAEFHSAAANTTLKITTDGTSKTAHQVFDAAGATVTCAGVSGHGLVNGSTTSTVTVEVDYEGPCTFVGQVATVEMGDCDYTFTSSGTVSITDKTGKHCGDNPIKIRVPSPFCEVTVSNTHPKAGGGTTTVNQELHEVTLHNINSNTEITIEPHVTNIAYIAHGAGCPQIGTGEDGNYTTGNAIVTGEAVGGGAMVAINWG